MKVNILERHFGGFYRKRSEKGAFVVVEQVPLELQVEREVEVLREFRITNCGCRKNVEMTLCWRTPPPHHRGPIGSNRTSRERGSCNVPRGY